MVSEERNLSRELTTFLNRFEAWTNEGAPLSKVPPSSSSAAAAGRGGKERRTTTSALSSTKGPETEEEVEGGRQEQQQQHDDGEEEVEDEQDVLEAQVEAIDRKIVKEGGPTGGWHPKEHEIFIGLWTQVGR